MYNLYNNVQINRMPQSTNDAISNCFAADCKQTAGMPIVEWTANCVKGTGISELLGVQICCKLDDAPNQREQTNITHTSLQPLVRLSSGVTTNVEDSAQQVDGATNSGCDGVFEASEDQQSQKDGLVLQRVLCSALDAVKLTTVDVVRAAVLVSVQCWILHLVLLASVHHFHSSIAMVHKKRTHCRSQHVAELSGQCECYRHS